MCLPLGAPPPGRRHHRPDHRRRAPSGSASRASRSSRTCAGCHAFINPFGFMQENYDAIGRWRTTRRGHADRRRASRSTSSTRARSPPSTPVEALRGFTALAALPAVLRAPAVPLLHGPRRGCRATTRCCARCSSTSPTTTTQDIVGMLRTLASSPTLLAAHGGTMKRRQGSAHPPRPDQALRHRWRSCSRPSRARWATSPGGTVRGRAALRDVLQGRLVPPAVDQPARRSPTSPARRSRRCAARRRTSSCFRA